MNWTIVNDRPIWIQLMEQITQRIVAGVYGAGTRVPSVRELAAEAEVNPNTMQRALAELERSGLVKTNRTTGRTVTEDTDMINQVKKELAGERVTEFLEGMKTLGFTAKEAAELLLQQANADGREETA